MTAAGAARAPLSRPSRVIGTAGRAGATGTPSLRLVPRRRSKAARAPFVIVVVLLVGGGLLGLLALNTLLNQDAFTLHALQKQNAALHSQQQVLQQEVDAREEPGALAAKAASLGMVPAEYALFLDLRTGRVLGNVDGEKADIPVVASKPTAPAKAAAPTSAPSAAPTAAPSTSAAPTTATGTATTPPTAAGGSTTPRNTATGTATTPADMRDATGTTPRTGTTTTGAGR